MFTQEIISSILFSPRSEINLGEKSRSYKVDKSHKEFYFFTKCPEDVLDVDVYKIEGGEIHVVENFYGSPKRFVYLKERDESLLSTHVLVINYNEGAVYVSKSCRFVLR
ncbi:MAG: hypothetical protein RJA76_434 [Bacteroidota bacterium]|jgi:hypothetical protein